MSDDKSTGKFDGYTHDQLYAMVANAKPEKLTAVADALEKAFDDLDKISKDLKVYVTRVKLEGQGGKAFHKWGEQMVMQTVKLAAYVSSAGDAMKKAGEGLSKAKSSMPAPDSMCYADVVKEMSRQANRQDAADVMTGLDSYYKVAHESLGKLEEPAFGLPPGLTGIDGEEERPYASSGSGGGASGGGRNQAVPPCPVLPCRAGPRLVYRGIARQEIRPCHVESI
ncbi:hypothetical protein ACFQ2B_08960 [Streptomyces stramineus]